MITKKMTESFINKFRRVTEPEYYKFFLIPRAKFRHFLHIRRIRKAGCIKVVFLLSSLPMWRLEKVFERFQSDSRFHLTVALFPFPFFAESQKKEAITALRAYFIDRGIEPLDLSHQIYPGKVLRRDIDPDIIFYQQPYNHLYWNDLDCQFFSKRLTCYIPYGMLLVQESWTDKNLLSETAWRLFYPSDQRKQQATKVLYNYGYNIRITGDPLVDLFRAPSSGKAWKAQAFPKKRIIWAPHFSIQDEGLLNQDSFIWLYELMLKMASKYQDCVQFSFKPHPRLLSILYELPEWGKERADAYYQTWAERDNTQLDTGFYLDLFKESDAMIHDSFSFSAEYHLSGKPALFTTKKLQQVLNKMNAFGRDALSTHYIGDSESKIVEFIEHTVLEGFDPQKKEREAFYQKYLLPPNGGSVAENIYHEVLSGLGFE